MILKEYIDLFFKEYDTPPSLSALEQEDWKLLLVYENSLRLVVEAAKTLEGELYPTGSSVIPFLDTIFEDLKKLSGNLSGIEKSFVEKLLLNLQSAWHFPLGYKEKSPYNILTLLDPRYSDLYFSSVEYEKCLDSLTNDAVYDDDIIQSRTMTDDESRDVNSNTKSVDSTDTFSKRRAELLAAKQASSQSRSGTW